MKRFFSFILTVAITLTLFAGCGTSGENTSDNGETAQVDTLTLVNEGVSDYVIVRRANASASEVTASTELQSYLKQISGAELPIVTDDTAAVDKEIVVGKTNREADGEFDRDELGDDGFVIKTEGNKLFLVGGEQRGTLYSVYEFLESYLGCRFYTNTVEKIPEMKTVSVSAIEEDKQIPVFEYRNVFWTEYFGEVISVKRKINGTPGRSVISDANGGSINYAGNFVHTFNSLVDPNIYFAEHPEYYSMGEDGTRNTYQHCLTNPDVIKIAIETARKWLTESPNATIISISQNDGGNPCQCENCKKVYEEEGSYSGAVIRFVNAVADALKDEFPNVKFDTLAYQYTRDMPSVTKPEDNVIVRLCSIECCFSHPIDECDVVAYQPSDSPVSDQSFAEDLKDWASIADTLYIWDYTTDFHDYCMTYPNFNVLRQNLLFFAENNVKGVFEQGEYQSASCEFSELRSYLLSKLLWNPYMTEEEYYACMDDFLEGVYGEGGKYIREYINLAQNITKDMHFGIKAKVSELYAVSKYDLTDEKALPDDLTLDMILDYENTDWTKYTDWYKGFTESEITSKGEELFTKAAELATDDEQLYRIDKATLQVDYMKSYYLFMNVTTAVYNIRTILQKYFEANETGLSAEEQDQLLKAVSKYALQQTRDAYAEYNQKLYNSLLEYGINFISEGTNISSIENPNFLATPDDWND